jgi:hypothetical protein
MIILNKNWKDKLYYNLTECFYDYNSLCDLLIDYKNEYKIDMSSMGRVCVIEQKEEIVAVRQGCSAHVAVMSTQTSDAENKKDNSLEGK